MIRIITITALFIIVAIDSLFAQNPNCGSDQIRFINNASQKETIINERIYQSIISKSGLPQTTGSIYTIPVVFHIMHNNGPENVPDSVVVAAVEELNLRYQNAPAYYDSIGHTVDVQFCLATVDPQGNPTTGITRTVTPYTNFIFPYDDQTLKNLDRWSPDLYYNVWVVFNISGFIDGYSSFPMYAGQSIDGVVIEYSYIVNSYLLGHETGHYCGLYHTFQDGCNNFNCMLNGDQVCDTPPDNSSTGFPCMANSCSTDMQDTSGFNPFTSDMNELPNYMDYTTCPNAFTQGQATRMETSVSLLRSNLMLSNGCGTHPGQAAPTAGFAFEVSPCNNGIVTFSDSLALNAVTSEWDFNNDGIYDTIANNFSYVFPASGTYIVNQRVTGFGGQDSATQIISVLKGPSFNYPIVNYPQAITDTLRVCEGSNIVFEGDTNGVSWLWSTGDTTAILSLMADSSMDISLTMTDTNGFTWTTVCAPIYMEVFPFNTPNITYDDTVGYMCQGELLHLYISNPIPGLYTWQTYHISTGWFNTGDHNTFYEIYPDPMYGHQFYVTYTNAAGCSTQSNTLLVQPQFLPFLNGVQPYVNGYVINYPSSGFQYQWYKDSIAIPGANSNYYTVTNTGCYYLTAWSNQYPLCETATDTVCFLFTGLENFGDAFGISISPNPSSGKFKLEYSFPISQPGIFEMFDINGRKVFESLLNSKGNYQDIDAGNLTSGVYQGVISLNGQRKVLKILLSD